MSIPTGQKPSHQGHSGPFKAYYEVVSDSNNNEIKLKDRPEKVYKKNSAYETLSLIEKNAERLENGLLEKNKHVMDYAQLIYDRYMDKYAHSHSLSKTWNDFLNLFRSVPHYPKRVEKVKDLYERVVNKLYTPVRPTDQEEQIHKVKAVFKYYYVDENEKTEKIVRCVDILGGRLDEAQRRRAFEHLIPPAQVVRCRDGGRYARVEKMNSMLDQVIQYEPLIYAMPTGELRAKILQELQARSPRQQDLFKVLATAVFDPEADPSLQNSGNPDVQTLITDFANRVPLEAEQRDAPLHEVLDYFLPLADLSIAEKREVLPLINRFKLTGEDLKNLKTVLDNLAPEERILALIELKKYDLSDGRISALLTTLANFPKADCKEAFDQIISQVERLNAPAESEPWRVLCLVLDKIAPALRKETLKKLLQDQFKLSPPAEAAHAIQFGFDSSEKIVSNLFLEDANLMQQSYDWMIDDIIAHQNESEGTPSIQYRKYVKQVTYDTLSRQNILTLLNSLPAEGRNKMVDGLNLAFCQGEIYESPWKVSAKLALYENSLDEDILDRDFNFSHYQTVVKGGSTDYFPAGSQQSLEVFQLFSANDLSRVFKHIASIPLYSKSTEEMKEILHLFPKEQRGEKIALITKLTDGSHLHLKVALEIVKLFPVAERHILLNEEMLESLYHRFMLNREVLRLIPESQRLAAIAAVPEMNQSLAAFVQEFEQSILRRKVLKDLRLLPEELRFPALKKLVDQIKEGQKALERQENPAAEQPGDQLAIEKAKEIEKCSEKRGGILKFLFKNDAELRQKTMTRIQNKIEDSIAKNHGKLLTPSERADAYAFACDLLHKDVYKKMGLHREDSLVQQAKELSILCDPTLRMEALEKDIERCAELFPVEQRVGLRENPDFLVALKTSGTLTEQALRVFPIEERLAQLKQVREIVDYSQMGGGGGEKERSDYWRSVLVDLRALPPEERLSAYQQLTAVEEKFIHIQEILEEQGVDMNDIDGVEELNGADPTLPEEAKIQPGEEEIFRFLAAGVPSSGKTIALLCKEGSALRAKTVAYLEKRLDVLLAHDAIIDRSTKAEAIALLKDFEDKKDALGIVEGSPLSIKMAVASALGEIHNLLKLIPEAERVNQLDFVKAFALQVNQSDQLKTAITDLQLIPEEMRLATLQDLSDPEKRLNYLPNNRTDTILDYLLENDLTLLPEIHETIQKSCVNYLERDLRGEMSELERSEAHLFAHRVLYKLPEWLLITRGTPLFDQVMEVYVLFYPDPSNKLDDADFLLQKLKILAKREVTLKEGPTGPVDLTLPDKTTITLQAALNLGELQLRAKRSPYTVDQLPTFPEGFDPLTYLKNFTANLTKRIKEISPDEKVQKVERTKAANLISALFLKGEDLSLESILEEVDSTHNILLNNTAQIPIFLHVEGGPKDQIPNTTFYLYSVLRSIAGAETKVLPGQSFSEREEQTLKFLQSVRNCSTGQKEGIAQFYNYIDPKYRQGTALIGSIEKVNKSVEDAIQTLLRRTLENRKLTDELSGHGVDDYDDQQVHKARYLKNRFAHHLGLVYQPEFDEWPKCIEGILSSTEDINDPIKGEQAKASLDRILKEIPPKLLVDVLKKSLADAAKKAKEIMEKLDEEYDTEKAKLDAAFKAVKDNKEGTEEERADAIKEAEKVQAEGMLKLRDANKAKKETLLGEEHLVTGADITTYLDETKIVMPNANGTKNWQSYMLYDDTLTEVEGISDIAAYEILKEMGLLIGGEPPKP